MMRARCPGKVWMRLETICTAVSVLPVPGGPTTTLSPGFMAARNASTCFGVKRVGFMRGWSSGYGPAWSALYASTVTTGFAPSSPLAPPARWTAVGMWSR